MDIAIVGGGITGLSLALNLHEHGLRLPRVRARPGDQGARRRHHAVAPCDAGIRGARPRRTSSSAPASPIRESCFFNRFGQLIYREDRGRHAGYPFPEVSIHRGRLHLILLRAAIDAARAPRRSSPTAIASASSRTRPASPCGSARRPRAAPLDAGPRRRRDRLRRRQLGAAQAVLSRRRGRLRRHQHLARHHPPQAVPHRPLLYAHRLDPDRQDRDLSDHRQRRRRRQPADQLDGGDQAGHLREERLEPARQARRFLRDLSGLALRLARRRRADPHRRPDPRISDGRQGPGRALDLRPGDPRRRRRPSDVSARLQRGGAGRDRRPHARRLPRRQPRRPWRPARRLAGL